MTKKIILILLGLIALIAGLAISAFGVAGLSFGGRSGVLQSGYHAISTPTDAFVSNPSEIRNSNHVGRTGNPVTLRVYGRNSTKPLFVGIGPSAQVAAYLNGAPYEQVTHVDFGPFRLTSTRIDGTTQPAAPADQSFWVAQATGSTPQLRWPVDDGDYRVVIMNADASPGVSLDARVGLKIKGLFGIALGATIFGCLLALLGLGLMIWGIAAKRKREEAVAGAYPTSSYPPPGGPPPTYNPPPGGTPPTYNPPPGGPPAQ